MLPSLDSVTWLCETFNLVSPRDLGARQYDFYNVIMLFTIYYNVIFAILNIGMDSTYARKYYILVYFHP
jgi:hypothetical protein